MKKEYESPSTELIELDAQNVLLGSFAGSYENTPEKKDSVDLPIDSFWD